MKIEGESFMENLGEYFDAVFLCCIYFPGQLFSGRAVMLIKTVVNEGMP